MLTLSRLCAVLCAVAAVTLTGIPATSAAVAPAAPAGTISTIAGGVGGPGLAVSVFLGYPCGVTYAAGHLDIAGDIYTIAGNGAPGFAGDGGPAIRAEMVQPSAIAVTASGNLVIGDNLRIRQVTR